MLAKFTLSRFANTLLEHLNHYVEFHQSIDIGLKKGVSDFRSIPSLFFIDFITEKYIKTAFLKFKNL